MSAVMDEEDLQDAITSAIDDVRKKIGKKRQVKEEMEKQKMTSTSAKSSLWSSVRARLKKKELRQFKDNSDVDTKEGVPTTKNESDELPDLSIMLSNQQERKISRRSGISERNQTERLVVRKTVENLVLIENLNEITEI